MPWCERNTMIGGGVVQLAIFMCQYCCNISISRFSPRASNTFNQVAEAKRFEGVFLCRKVC